jgi:hypothetical protein
LFYSDKTNQWRTEGGSDKANQRSYWNTWVILIKQIRGVNTAVILIKQIRGMNTASDLFYQNQPSVLL